MKTPVTAFVLAVSLLTPNVVTASDCTLDRSVLRAVNTDHAEPAWNRAGRAVSRLIMCQNGPADYASRAVFFQYAEQELAHDDAMIRSLARRGPDWAEAAWENEHYFHVEIRQYLDRIVVPEDTPFAPMVLQLANARAISRLGHAVKDDVLRSAQTEQSPIGVDHHLPQREAIGAIGLWIDPANTEFSAAEKSEMNALLIHQLSQFGPSSGSVIPGAIVDALSHSDQAEAARALHEFARSQFDPAPAEHAARAVEQRIQH